MTTIQDLAARVFVARDVVHREHWKTSSFSQHMALGAFYDDVIESVDEIVECYQGEFGLIGDFSVETPSVFQITPWLQSEMAWIQENVVTIANGSASIRNLLDGLVAIYQRTIYKLTFLA